MLKAGDKAPLFQLADDGGQLSSLEERLADGPVLLAFFKTTCPTCQLAFPFLERLSAESGVPVVGVSQDDSLRTRAFKSEYGVTFPTLLDTAQSLYPISNAYRITHVPSLFLIEPDRKIALSESGFSRRALEEIGQRFGGAVFRKDEQVPEYKPG